MIEKPLTPEDVEFVTTLHGEEQISFVVLMQPRSDQADVLLRAIDDVAIGELREAVREGTSRRARRPASPPRWRWSTRSGSCARPAREAVGQVVEDHPLDKLKTVVDDSGADEVIVLTAPHYVEEFFHRDWASRARHKVGVPVLKLFAHSE